MELLTLLCLIVFVTSLAALLIHLVQIPSRWEIKIIFLLLLTLSLFVLLMEILPEDSYFFSYIIQIIYFDLKYGWYILLGVLFSLIWYSTLPLLLKINIQFLILGLGVLYFIYDPVGSNRVIFHAIHSYANDHCTIGWCQNTDMYVDLAIGYLYTWIIIAVMFFVKELTQYIHSISFAKVHEEKTIFNKYVNLCVLGILVSVLLLCIMYNMNYNVLGNYIIVTGFIFLILISNILSAIYTR